MVRIFVVSVDYFLPGPGSLGTLSSIFARALGGGVGSRRLRAVEDLHGWYCRTERVSTDVPPCDGVDGDASRAYDVYGYENPYIHWRITDFV